MFWASILVQCFGGLFVWIVSRLAADRLMSLEILKCPPSSSVAYNQPISITSVLSKPLRCLNAWCWLVTDEFWNAVVWFQPPSLLIGQVWVPVMHFFACPIHCKLHWRMGQRLGSCRLISAQPLKGSTSVYSL